jgi:hypothetical protein
MIQANRQKEVQERIRVEARRTRREMELERDFLMPQVEAQSESRQASGENSKANVAAVRFGVIKNLSRFEPGRVFRARSRFREPPRL